MIDQNKYQELIARGVTVVFDPAPEPRHDQPIDRKIIVEQVGPTLVGSQWHMQWITRMITAEERESRRERDCAATRAQRDKYLAETDVYVYPDRWQLYTEQQKALWTAFRQGLRDLPNQPGFPYDIAWPTHPLGSYL